MNEAFRDALARHRGNSQSQRLLRSSLVAAESYYNPKPRTRLVVDIEGSDLSPQDSAAIMTAIVDATAMFSRHRTNPRKPVTHLRSDYRNSVLLRSVGAYGSSLIFDLPAPPITDEPSLLEGMKLRSLTDHAVRDMCQLLPEGPDDDLALDAVLSLPATQRVAIQQLVKAVTKTKRSLSVSLLQKDEEGEDIAQAVLLRTQAEVLQSSLLEAMNHTVRMPSLIGILDGMRTHRRIFFLEREAEPDIYGSVSEEILILLPPLIGKLVSVDLERSVMLQRSGKSSRPIYRLLGIQLANATLIDP